jgi:hypothetical protein
VKHGQLFKIRVTSVDGEQATVTWQIDDHRAETLDYVLQNVARDLRLADADAALDALTNWSKQDLVTHLQQFTKESLMPPSMRLPR